MRIYLLFLFLFISTSLLAQKISGTETADSTNIYCDALARFLSSYGVASTTILIESNDMTQDQCSQTNKDRIRYVDGLEVKKLLKKQEQITVVRVVQLRVKQGDFFINFIPFKVTSEKRNYRYANSGGASVHYQFNAETKLFEFTAIKTSGI